MTKQIQLSYGSDVTTTAISNIFIDEYMAAATGLQNKVYIYLLRCMKDRMMDFSVASIADKLDETEKDIVRALKYWEKKKLLNIAWDGEEPVRITVNPLTHQLAEDNIVTISSATSRRSIAIEDEPEVIPAPVSVPEIPKPVVSKPSYSPKQLARFRENDEFNRLLDHIEEKLGCTLKPSDLQTPAFLYEQLEMSPELIRFLYDYCIYKGTTAPSYIDKVAISWNEKGIDSVEKARTAVFSRSKECSSVKTAFGLGRGLGAIELEFIDRWRNEYGMSPELISEACSRTLLKLGKPDFKYADGILDDWHKANATNISDLAGLDAAHNAKVRQAQARKATQPAASNNKFNQFQQRTYTTSDYDDLESRKLGI